MKWCDESIKEEMGLLKEIKENFPSELIFEVRSEERAAVEQQEVGERKNVWVEGTVCAKILWQEGTWHSERCN